MSEEEKPNNNDCDEIAFKVPELKSFAIRKPPVKLVKSAISKDNDESNNISPDIFTETPPIQKTEDTKHVEQDTKCDSSLPKSYTIPYKEPSWSEICEEGYKVEVLKSGIISETIELINKSNCVFGRFPGCQHIMYHPSISRYHAVLQYRKCKESDEESDSENRPSGWYLYDLDSTHGTFLNKTQLKPKVYYRIRVGHMIKFGNSSRMFILQGPEFDQESESEETVTELIELRKKQENQLIKLENDEANEPANDDDENIEPSNSTPDNKNAGINWGLGEDAEEEPDLSVNPYALSTGNEELYLDDPKKTLRGYFEREGCELEYKVEEKGYSHFICRVELPIDSATGNSVVAEASVKGKKKEAVVQCALEACRILDRQGLLRQAKHVSRKRKDKNWEDEDFYDSDDDTFLDRTGSIEEKRQKRMVKAQKTVVKAETHESLIKKFEDIEVKIKDMEDKLLKSKESSDNLKSNDSLDDYMTSINAGDMLDKTTVASLKIQLVQLRKEKLGVQKLIDVAKPANMPSLKKLDESLKTQQEMKKRLPLIGSMKGNKVRFKYATAPKVTPVIPDILKSIVAPIKEVAEEQMDVKDITYAKEVPEVLNQELKTEAPGEKFLNENAEVVTNPNQPTDAETPEISENQQHEIAKLERKELKKKQKLQKKKEQMNYVYDSSDPNYALWVPPDDQQGDGKTHLNQRFGY